MKASDIKKGLIARYELFEDEKGVNEAADVCLAENGFARQAASMWVAPDGDADDIFAKLCAILPKTARVLVIPLPLFHFSDIRGHNLLTNGGGALQ